MKLESCGESNIVTCMQYLIYGNYQKLQSHLLEINFNIQKTFIRIKHNTFIFHLKSKNFECSIFYFLEEEVESKVENLDATEDGEASEESHCSSDKT